MFEWVVKIMERKKITTKITINGVEYNSLDELPENIKNKLSPLTLKALSGDSEAAKKLAKKGKTTTKIVASQVTGGSPGEIPDEFKEMIGSSHVKNMIKINGVEYNSYEEIPEDIRENLPVSFKERFETHSIKPKKVIKEIPKKGLVDKLKEMFSGKLK